MVLKMYQVGLTSRLQWLKGDVVIFINKIQTYQVRLAMTEALDDLSLVEPTGDEAGGGGGHTRGVHVLSTVG
jgi:hypothetical protein